MSGMLENILDFLFPSQCGGCETIGTGLCDACAPCVDIVHARSATLNVRAVGVYEGPLRRAVLALKDGRRDVAHAMGAKIAALLEGGERLVPVPTTRARRFARVFDGSELLASAAAALKGAQVCRILAKSAGDAQRGRNRSARLAARGRFRCKQSQLGAQRFILVDDVMTTGATLEDCAATIRSAGGIVQDAVVIAISEDG